MKNLKDYLLEEMGVGVATPSDTIGMGDPQTHELIRPEGIPHEEIKIKRKKKPKKIRFKRDFL